MEITKGSHSLQTKFPSVDNHSNLFVQDYKRKHHVFDLKKKSIKCQ